MPFCGIGTAFFPPGETGQRRKTMRTEQAKQSLTNLIDFALARDAAGDVVGRQQQLRTIEDLPLPAKYVRESLKNAGLIGVYKG